MLIDVADLPGLGFGLDIDNLVSGRYQGHLRLFVDRKSRDSDPGERA